MRNEEPTTEPAAPGEQAASPHANSPVPAGLVRPTGRYTARFAVIYALLGLILAGAVAGFVLLVVKPGTGSPTGWSSWAPPRGSTAKMTNEIADHVAHEYRLNKGGTQLVAVVSEPPEVTSGTHKISISNIAVRETAQTDKGIQIINSGGVWVDQFCGLSPSCAISTGKATVTRGRLVRREALEVALYTFKFVPSISSVVAFMPPPPGSTASTLLYLQKTNLTKELSQPLAKTLPLATPPLPTNPDTAEASTIDKLTLPAVYKYQLQQLQDASALLVLNPFST